MTLRPADAPPIQVPSMSPEEPKNWVAERRTGVQSSRFGVESIEWRDYRSCWHKAYWDLMYNKLYFPYARQVVLKNEQQAAKIMEMELEINKLKRYLDFHKQRWEKIKPHLKKSLGLRGSKWVRHE